MRRGRCRPIPLASAGLQPLRAQVEPRSPLPRRPGSSRRHIRLYEAQSERARPGKCWMTAQRGFPVATVIGHDQMSHGRHQRAFAALRSAGPPSRRFSSSSPWPGTIASLILMRLTVVPIRTLSALPGLTTRRASSRDNTPTFFDAAFRSPSFVGSLATLRMGFDFEGGFFAMTEAGGPPRRLSKATLSSGRLVSARYARPSMEPTVRLAEMIRP